jgi:chemotaxis signal transduction protein
LNTEFIRGIGKKENKLTIILDVEKIFSRDGLSLALIKSQGESMEEVKTHVE